MYKEIASSCGRAGGRAGRGGRPGRTDGRADGRADGRQGGQGRRDQLGVTCGSHFLMEYNHYF